MSEFLSSLESEASRCRGFSLFELLVAMLVLAMLAAGSFQLAEPVLARQRTEAFLRESATLMHRARVEAIRLGTPVVVRVDRETRTLEAFADFALVDGKRGSDLRFEPEHSGPVPLSTVDYRIALLPLPDAPAAGSRLELWGIDDAEAWGPNAIDGFTADPRATDEEPLPPLAVFEPDGSIRDIGSFRFGLADPERTILTEGNFYEVRVAPAATALVELRKYILHDPDSLSNYYPRDSTPGKVGWTWY